MTVSRGGILPAEKKECDNYGKKVVIDRKVVICSEKGRIEDRGPTAPRSLCEGTVLRAKWLSWMQRNGCFLWRLGAKQQQRRRIKEGSTRLNKTSSDWKKQDPTGKEPGTEKKELLLYDKGTCRRGESF